MNSIDIESDEILKEALDSGMDLNQYLNNINDQIVDAEQETIDDSLNQIATLNNLYSRLKTTDSTLEQLENILVNFQENLGSISSEIQSLQETSLDISINSLFFCHLSTGCSTRKWNVKLIGLPTCLFFLSKSVIFFITLS